MTRTHRTPRRFLLGKPREKQRRGAVLALAAFFMVVMMAMLAFSIDLGYIMNTQSELKRATDAAALAGAGALIDGADVAQVQALDFMLRNPVGGQAITDEENRQALLEAWLAQHPDEFEVALGQWDPDTRTFASTDNLPSTIQVVASRNQVPLFFARALGVDSFDLQAESIARYQPRDIVLVLDFSGSMNDDSELRRIREFGESARQAVEDNLALICTELNPSYGTLQFEPDYVTLIGQPPTTGCEPQITVKFLESSKQVYVTSTKDLSNVVLEYSDGSKQKTEGLSDPTGTFGGGSKRITKVWVKSGCNASGEGPGYGERFELAWTSDNERIREGFELDSVSYPYPSGSWNSYINYVKSNYYVRKAGYKKMYGYMTLINYWLESRPKYSQTPDLWMVSAQPVTAVKDSVDVFMTYIQQVDCEDRIGLVVYNSPSQNALVEHTLTDDFDAIGNTVEQRQAAHYDCYTNIGAGIYKARLELRTVANGGNARTGSFKMIVLMTDGIANRPGGTSSGRAYALEQAELAAGQGLPIVSISLGGGADTNLMQQIADLTNGVHFNVPGGGAVTDYEDDLLAIFRQIADDRPLVLVR